MNKRKENSMKLGSLISSFGSVAFVVFIIIIFFGGCGVKPSKIDNPQKFAEKTTYYKDKKTGLCFGIVAIKKAGIRPYQEGVGLTCVPCEALEDAGLIEKIEKKDVQIE